MHKKQKKLTRMIFFIEHLIAYDVIDLILPISSENIVSKFHKVPFSILFTTVEYWSLSICLHFVGKINLYLTAKLSKKYNNKTK